MSMIESAFAFEMLDISKRFGAVEALRNVSLAARPGSIHALCGENGAGKSVLSGILAGVYRPDSGEIRIGGQPFSLPSPAAAVRAGVSMVFQESDLAPDLTVAENVFLGTERLLGARYAHVLDGEGMNQETDELIDCYGFLLKPDTPVSELTPAKRQQVEILKSLNRRAHILILDEPAASLSMRETQELFAIIRGLRNTGMTVVYVSYRLGDLMEIADEVTVLRDGVRVYSGARSAVNSDRVVRLMVGRDPGDIYPTRESRPGPVFFEAQDLSDRAGYVNRVRFSLRRGEIVGLAGLVGSGRSETAKLISGITRPASGTLLFDGVPVRFRSLRQARKRNVAFVPDDRTWEGIIPTLTGAANLMLPNYARYGMRFLISPWRELRFAGRLGRLFQLGWPSPRTRGSELSAGTRRKLQLARRMVADIRLLILDEPTRSVDIESRRQIYDLMFRFARRGRTILLISSDLNELFGVTDRILVMRGGRVTGDLTTKTSTPEEVMRLAAVDE